MTDRPKLKRDWIGRRVKLLREIEANGGQIFPAGVEMEVTRHYRGLHLEYVDACKDCRLKFRYMIKEVPEKWVELLP